MANKKVWIGILIAVAILSAVSPQAGAESEKTRSRGQLVYVPIYPSVYIDDRGRDLNMASSLSIRNTDPDRQLVVMKADYFDSAGKPVSSYLASPVTLGPLASMRLLVKTVKTRTKSDGDCFLVEWISPGGALVPPIIESVTIGSEGTQGISFVQNGRIISEKSQD